MQSHTVSNFPTLFQRYGTSRTIQTFIAFFLNSSTVSKPILSYLGVFLLPREIIADVWKAWQAPENAIFRSFSSDLLPVALFKALLQFFECVCRLETNSSLLGRIFAISTNFSQWSKSPPGLAVISLNSFKLIWEGFYYPKKWLTFTEKPARPLGMRFSAIFPALCYH